MEPLVPGSWSDHRLNTVFVLWNFFVAAFFPFLPLITLARYSSVSRDFTTKPFQRNRSYLASSPDTTNFSRIYDSSLLLLLLLLLFFLLASPVHACNIREFRPINLIAFKYIIFKEEIFLFEKKETWYVTQVLKRPLSKWSGRQVEAERREIDCLNGREKKGGEGV